MMTQAGGEFVECHAVILIGVQAAEDGRHALGVSAIEGWEGGKLLKIETAVFPGNLGELFFALDLQGLAACVSCCLLLFVGQFSVTIGVELCNVFCAALGTCCTTCLFGCLALFLVDLAVLVQVVLLKNLGQFAIAEGAMPGTTGDNSNPQGNSENSQVFQFHHFVFSAGWF